MATTNTTGAVEKAKAKMDWQDRLDMIDPFFGSTQQLNELLNSAPTQKLHAWLAKQIARNMLLEPLFRAPETPARC